MTDYGLDPRSVDPEYDRHGGFPLFEPAAPGPGFERFLTAMRRAQDLAVSANPDPDTWSEAADRYSLACVAFFLLTGHEPPVDADISELRRLLAAAPRLAGRAEPASGAVRDGPTPSSARNGLGRRDHVTASHRRARVIPTYRSRRSSACSSSVRASFDGSSSGATGDLPDGEKTARTNSSDAASASSLTTAAAFRSAGAAAAVLLRSSN